MRALSSLISLLLNENTDINSDWFVVKFKLNPFKDAGCLVWKSNFATPLLVSDPQENGNVEDSRQFFDNFTSGNRDGLNKIALQTSQPEWIWKNGYEPLEILDLDKESKISGY